MVNFKNFDQAEMEFSSRINCFTGNNGTGKTNILDAIHYLSFCKSYFNPTDSQNIKHDEQFFVIQGAFAGNNEDDKVYCGVKRSQKKIFRRNHNEYLRLSEHIGLYPVVMISPDDTDLIHEGSESRRRFIDGAISQYNRQYLDDLIAFNKILVQRNALLKIFAEKRHFDADAIEIWDEKLVLYSQKIYNERLSFVSEFVPIFNQHFHSISGGNEEVNVRYESQLADGNFAHKLKTAHQKDMALEYSSVGAHKDDLIFELKNYPIKKTGSQGQQKTFLVALKLAEFDFIRKVKKFAPVLLLDDIFDKLDNNRIKNLMQLVCKENFQQIFITDTDEDRLMAMFEGMDSELKIFRIEDGKVLCNVNTITQYKIVQ